MNGKDDDVDDEDTNSKSPHASSPHGNHSTKPASTSPLAVRSTDEIGSGRSTSPISPSSSPATKEVLTNQHAQQQHHHHHQQQLNRQKSHPLPYFKDDELMNQLQEALYQIIHYILMQQICIVHFVSLIIREDVYLNIIFSLLIR